MVTRGASRRRTTPRERGTWPRSVRSIARVLSLSAGLGLAGCDASPPRARESEGGPLRRTYSAILSVPDRVTLLGAAHGLPIRLLGRTATGELVTISSDEAEMGSSDEGVVRAAGGRLRGVSAGHATIEVLVGEEAASIEVDVLAEPPPFASSIVEQRRGEGDGFGRDRLPDVVLGPPRGGGSHQGSFDTLSLGIGGSITLGLSTLVAYDGPGADLIVSENAFEVGSSNETFAEPGTVAVAFDGGAYVDFACEADAPPFRGCAGVHPVWAGSSGDIDPTDPERAGGDVFDLDGVLPLVDRVRVTDAGTGVSSGSTSGFDLDALTLVHVLTHDVRALVAPLGSLRMRIGEERPLPRIDAVRADGRSIDGVSVEWSAGEASPIATVEPGIVRAVGLGTGVLRAIAGPYSVEVSLEVTP